MLTLQLTAFQQMSSCKKTMNYLGLQLKNMINALFAWWNKKFLQCKRNTLRYNGYTLECQGQEKEQTRMIPKLRESYILRDS